MAAQGRQRGVADLTELAAAKFIESHGRDGLSILEERADLAEENGHSVAARTWHDLADAAARLLGIERLRLRPWAAPVRSRAGWEKPTTLT